MDADFSVLSCLGFFPFFSTWQIKEPDGISSLLRTTAGEEFAVGVQKQARGQFVICCCTAESEVIMSLLSSLRRLGKSTHQRGNVTRKKCHVKLASSHKNC